jgi:alanine racemase
MAQFPRTWAEIDLSAFRSNIGEIRSAIGPKVKLCLVMKADSYGHGLIPMARAAARFGADWIAVATVQEGIALREAEIDAPILVLAPALPIESAQVVFYDLRSQLESLESAAAISAAAMSQSKIANVHMKIDTGMARFGVHPQRALQLAQEILALPNVELEGAATHFADSSRNPEFTKKQFETFQAVLCEMQAHNIVPKIRHAGNSGSILKYPEFNLDMVRVGIFAYGISHQGPTRLNLRPVLTWKARIMAMRELPKGAKVGYNTTYETTRPSRIATLGVGYGDGYHRMLSNKGFVVIHNQRAPIRGLVCMDQMMVDVTDIPTAQVGDEAVLLGEAAPAHEFASLVGTTPHEFPTRIMSRVPRRYLNG